MRISFFTHDIPRPSLCLIRLSAPSSLWPHCSTGRSGLEYWFTWGKSMCSKAVLFVCPAILSSPPVPALPLSLSRQVLFLTQILERNLPSCHEQIYLLNSQDKRGKQEAIWSKELIHKNRIWNIHKIPHHNGCIVVTADPFTVHVFSHLNTSLSCTELHLGKDFFYSLKPHSLTL